MNTDNKESYREIKFRGIAINPFDNWVYGSLLVIKDCETENKTYKILQDGGGQIRVTTESIGQYANLLDKNSKKIFENDILKGENEVIYIIKWIKAIGGFYLSIPNTYRGKEIISCAASQWHNEEVNLYKLEIIGNIHDTPELIKQ